MDWLLSTHSINLSHVLFYGQVAIIVVSCIFMGKFLLHRIGGLTWSMGAGLIPWPVETSAKPTTEDESKKEKINTALRIADMMDSGYWRNVFLQCGFTKYCGGKSRLRDPDVAIALLVKHCGELREKRRFRYRQEEDIAPNDIEKFMVLTGEHRHLEDRKTIVNNLMSFVPKTQIKEEQKTHKEEQKTHPVRPSTEELELRGQISTNFWRVAFEKCCSTTNNLASIEHIKKTVQELYECRGADHSCEICQLTMADVKIFCDAFTDWPRNDRPFDRKTLSTYGQEIYDLLIPFVQAERQRSGAKV